MGQEKKVDKKLLIMVSILAVVLFVLGSLSNVVGYQSVRSTTVNDSPLFTTRTQRATNQQTNSITTQYLGMGGRSHLQFLPRDNRTEQLRKVVDIVGKMDKKTFARFTELCIHNARQNDTLQGLSHCQIIQSLLFLKANPDAIKNFYTKGNNLTHQTYGAQYTMCGAWFPGCWILSIISLIIIVIIFISIG